MIIFIYISMF